ncbi:hypothetical protein AADZ91_13120 [Colwelliaceae bacterium 6441]
MTENLSAQAIAGLAAYRKSESECYNNSDLAIVENFAEDIILTSNGVDNVVGRQAMKDLFTAVWAEYDARFAEVHDDVVVESADYLFVTGRFTLELKPKAGGETIFDHGRFQGVLVKSADGRYLLWRESCMDVGAEKN